MAAPRAEEASTAAFSAVTALATAAVLAALAAFIAAAMAAFAMAASITAMTTFAVTTFAMSAVAALAMSAMTALAMTAVAAFAMTAVAALAAFMTTVIMSAMVAVIMIVVVAVTSALARWRRQRRRLIVDVGAALHDRIAEPNRTQRVEARRTDDVRRTIIAEGKVRLFVRRLALGAATLSFTALQCRDDLRDRLRRHEERLRHRPAARRAYPITRARERLAADVDETILMHDERAA